MTYKEAVKKMIEKYGKTEFFICEDCSGWSHEDVIYQASLID